MRFRLLGRSGLRVSELCLGTMTFGEDWGWGGGVEDCRRMFDAFAGAGGNFIDTANLYTNGSSERIVAELIAADRERWVLATKFSLSMADHVNASGNHRKNMMQAVEASLKRLKTEYIDLYWLHAWDFTTPVEEVMRGFDDLVRAGKILYAGVSDTPAWIVSQSNTLANLRGWSPFVGMQVQYSLIERTVERDLLPMAKALDIGITAWSPLGGGVLTGKYNQPDSGAGGRLKTVDDDHSRQFLTKRNLRIAAEVVAVAKDIGRTPSQVALRWLLQRHVPCLPIIGGRKLGQIEDNLKCLEFSLSAEQIERLDRVSAIDLGFPHDFLVSSMVRKFAFGGQLENISNPADPAAALAHHTELEPASA
jgi:aryl-alcohol dehydrogenase-like predicted oxidoreductase